MLTTSEDRRAGAAPGFRAARRLIAIALLLLIVNPAVAGATSARLDGDFGRAGHVLTPGLGVVRAAEDRAGRLLAASGNEDSLLLTRYLADGTLDRSFGKDGAAEVSLSRFVRPKSEEQGGSGIARASAVAIQPNGKILVAGTIDTDVGSGIGGVSVLARLRPNGGVDSGFGGLPEVQSTPGQLTLGATIHAILPREGKILLAGERGRGVVIRLTADGGLDPNFGVGKRPGQVALPPPPENKTRYHVNAGFAGILEGPRGTVYASGFDLGASLLVRLRRDGGLDRSFADEGMVEVNPSSRRGCGCFTGGSLAQDHRYRLLVAGSLEAQRGDSLHRQGVVARYLPNGELDRTFGDFGFIRVSADMATYVEGVAVDHRGRIVLTGSSARANFASNDGPASFTVIRLLPSGHPDPSFFGDGIFKSRFGGVEAGAVEPLIDRAGRLIVAGAVTHGVRFEHLESRGILVRFR